eukprot:15458682-Alexandrium_andersonii.AAC.1
MDGNPTSQHTARSTCAPWAPVGVAAVPGGPLAKDEGPVAARRRLGACGARARTDRQCRGRA